MSIRFVKEKVKLARTHKMIFENARYARMQMKTPSRTV